MTSEYSGAAMVAAVLLAAICVVASSRSAAEAADAKAGRSKAMMCQACHGLDGLSKVPDAPNIAGQVESYLVTQLQAFKSGTRKNDAMSVVAGSLSEQDIDNLAAYYSAISIDGQKNPAQ